MSLPSLSGMLSGQHGYGPNGNQQQQGGWGQNYGGYGQQQYGGQGQQQYGGQGVPAEEPSKPELPFIPAQPPVVQNPQFNAKEVKQGGSSGNQQHGNWGPQQGDNRNNQGPHGGFGPGGFGPHGGFNPYGGNGPHGGFDPHGGNGPHGQWGQQQGNQGYQGYPQQGGYNQQQGGYNQQPYCQQQPAPESAHEHPLNYNQNLNENCKICQQKLEGKDGYKCGDCPIVLCLNCANRIFYGNKKKSAHPQHELALKNRNSWKCDICKKMYRGIASFYCKQCDFDVCDKCYLEEVQQQPQGYQPQGYQPQGYQGYPPQGGYNQPNYQQPVPESAHEHPLNYDENLKDKCKICSQNINGQAGYKCGDCPIILCLNCANRIFYGNKKKSAHPQHELALKSRNSWKCDLCKKMYKGTASFYCNKCDFDACDKCYLEEVQQQPQGYQPQGYQPQGYQGYPPQGGYNQQPYYQQPYYQQPVPESAHEHPLNYNQNLNENCRVCQQKIEGKDGYKCGDCPLVLCLNCSNRIFYGNKKKSIHPHDLELKSRNSWRCNLCKKIYRGTASFYCKNCDFDACQNCYLQS